MTFGTSFTSYGTAVEAPPRRLPGLVPTIVTVLLPVMLMLLRAVGELTLDEDSGVRAVVQPGGSVRDEEVVEAARAAGVTMYFTGERHFFH